MTDMHLNGMFIDDIEPTDSAYGITVRSPIAKGSIQKIELPDLPPGYWAVQAADIPGDPLLRFRESDMPFLAGSQVRYPGEPLLLLAGPDMEILAGLAGAVQIRCREAEAVTHLAEVDTRRLKPELHMIQGNPEKAFQDSYQIVEGMYSIGMQNPLGSTPRGAVAFTENRTLTVWAAVLDPFFLRDQIAALLAVSPRRIRVRVPRVSHPREAPALTAVLAAGHAALLSHAGGRAVKLRCELAETACSFPRSSPCRIRQSTALDREGNQLGVRLEIVLTSGAYRTCTRQALRDAILAVCGTYRCDNIEVEGKLAQTNTSPVDLSAATGQAAAVFATELQQTRLAEISQLDPYVWKRQRLKVNSAAERRATGAAEVLAQAVAAADFRRKHAAYAALNTRRKTYLAPPHPLRGVGLSLCVQTEEGEQSFGLASETASPRSCTVKVGLEADKKLHIYSSIVETGQRKEDIFADTAASVLGLAREDIVIEPVDTLRVPDSGFSTLAQTFEIGRLIGKCCQAIRKQGGSTSRPLEVRRSSRRVFAPVPGQDGGAKIPKAAGAWAATVVEVEVNAETLLPSCRQIVMVVDAGKIPDPDYARAQLEAGIISALRRVVWEGRSRTPGLSPGALISGPGIPEAPQLAVSFLTGPAKDNVCRGFDDLADLGVPAAYVAAVSQATGLYIDEIPLTAEVIQRCLLAAEK
jgi:CO/xanthine dehydrogenase Mo-binding subunit